MTIHEISIGTALRLCRAPGVSSANVHARSKTLLLVFNLYEEVAVIESSSDAVNWTVWWQRLTENLTLIIKLVVTNKVIQTNYTVLF